jgi:hypothetical protein
VEKNSSIRVKTTDLAQTLDKCYHANSSRVKPVTVGRKIILIARGIDMYR